MPVKIGTMTCLTELFAEKCQINKATKAALTVIRLQTVINLISKKQKENKTKQKK